MKKTVATETWPLEVKSGSAVVKIYRTQKVSGYVSYSAVYYKGRERKVRFFQELAEVKIEAKKIADDITHPEVTHHPLPIGAFRAPRHVLEPCHLMKLVLQPCLGIGEQFSLRRRRSVCWNGLRQHKRCNIIVDSNFSLVYTHFMKKDRLQNATPNIC